MNALFLALINSRFATYERVQLKPSKHQFLETQFDENLAFFPSVTIIRPVVLLGPLADIARDQLLTRFPDEYELPGK